MILRGHSRILGTGSFIPDTAVASVDLLEELHTEARFGIQATWMDDALGIHSRRYCDDKARPSEVATAAALEALADAGLGAGDIGAVIYCGITGDGVAPGTARAIHRRIGAGNSLCRDVTNACHGFCDGLLFADLMIGNGVEHALVVTAELTRVSRLAFPTLAKEKDKARFLNTVGMLTVGDGAGAMVLGRQSGAGPGIEVINTVSDGKYSDLCNYNVTNGEFQGGMVMDKISYIGVRQCVKQLSATLGALDEDGNRIRHFILHQVGSKPYESALKIISKTLGYIPAHVPKTFDYLGNVTTATLPLNVDLLKKSGKISRGDKMLLLGTGSGILSTWFGVAF